MSGFYRSPITPGETWFKSSGGSAPAAGGFLLTYLAGTLTPQSTFTDDTGAVPNPVPTGLPFPNQGGIVLDANGMLPATSSDVWLSGGIAYRFILWDSLGNVLADVDNIQGMNDPAFASPNTGEWITGAGATWISSAATANGTVFSLTGDQRAYYQPNRRLQIQAGGLTQYGRIASSVFAGGLTTITVDMDIGSAGVVPTVANPITANAYGIENAGGSQGLGHGLPSAVLTLGFKRSPNDGSGRTGTDLFGPIGSNLVTFAAPPEVVASAGGAGNQVVTGTVNGVAGSLTFNKTAHGRLTGEVVQLTTSNTLPGGTALATDFIVFKVDANNFGLYAKPAGWQFEQPYLDPLTTPAGLTWGNPVAFSTAGVGNQTVTPGFEVPTGVTRVYCRLVGGGGGGGGAANSGAGNAFCANCGHGGGYSEGWLPVVPGTWMAASVGAGGANGTGGGTDGSSGGTTTFSTMSGTGGGGGKGSAAAGRTALSNAPGTGSGGMINIAGGLGGSSFGSAAAAQYWQGGGGGSVFGQGFPPLNDSVNSGPAARTIPGTGGGGGASAAAGGASAGAPGVAGLIAIAW